MAHYQQKKFIESVKEVYPRYFQGVTVLEVGSWDLNGSVRQFFDSEKYVGIDIASGVGVDLVYDGEKIPFEEEFDVVISCECFEHNRTWRNTFLEMNRVLKPGGLCLITCAGIARGEHGTKRCVPTYSLSASHAEGDYYRNLDILDFQPLCETFFGKDYLVVRNIFSRDIYVVGRKKGAVKFYLNFNERLEDLRERSRKIKTERSLSFRRSVLLHLDWTIRFFAAKSLGEVRYHDLVFSLKKLIRRSF